MRHLLWLASAAAATLLSGCAVYPAGPVAGPPPGVVYGAPVQGGVAAAPVPYGYGYPYEYAYGGPAYYYGPPVFFSAGIGFVSRGGHAHGYRPGYYGGARTSGGLHVIPRQLRR